MGFRLQAAINGGLHVLLRQAAGMGDQGWKCAVFRVSFALSSAVTNSIGRTKLVLLSEERWRASQKHKYKYSKLARPWQVKRRGK